MKSMKESLESFKRWARLTPLIPGPIADGSIPKRLGASSVVIILIDDHGRVYQILDKGDEKFSIHNGVISPIRKGRSALIELMDKLDVQDNDSPDVVTAED